MGSAATPAAYASTPMNAAVTVTTTIMAMMDSKNPMSPPSSSCMEGSAHPGV